MYLYVIQAENGLCKIGISNNIVNRFLNIRADSPIEVRLLLCICAPDINRLERDLHSLFSGKCHHNEWYHLTEADIAYIASQGESIPVDFGDTGIREIKDLLGRVRYSVACPNCSGRSIAKHRKGKLFLNCKYCGHSADIK